MVVDFSNLELNKLSPIYMQIIRFVKMGILSNTIPIGAEMPSRRVLSALLSVNPNTIQKAYKQLEEERLLLSFAGSKSLIDYRKEQLIKIREELVIDETHRYISSIKGMGMSLEEANHLISHLWDLERGGEGNEKL